MPAWKQMYRKKLRSNKSPELTLTYKNGMKNIISFIFLFFFVTIAFAQEFANVNINQVDDKGRKQGDWKAYDVNGNLKFEGRFINSIPLGTFTYYYPDGKVKAVSEMFDNGRRSRTKVYHNNTRLMAEGNYLDKKKDSTWNYYSDFDAALLSTEYYEDGELHGTVYNYFPGGEIAEQIPYKNGIKEGVWKQYFTDGKLKLKATYVNDKLEGLMLVYYQNGVVEVSGLYVNNFKDGIWMYFSDRGETIKKETYKEGRLKKTEKFESRIR